MTRTFDFPPLFMALCTSLSTRARGRWAALGSMDASSAITLRATHHRMDDLDIFLTPGP
jgi:hypothetical protein